MLRGSSRTSGRLLIDYIWSRTSGAGDPWHDDACRKAVLAQDVWIKCRSYTILNKLFFFLALVGAVLVVAWPAIISFEPMKSLLGAAVVQTALTAITGLFVYIYQQYKRAQSAAEELLREIAYSDASFEELRPDIVATMRLLDQGLRFTKALGRDEAGKDGKAA